MAFPAVSSWRSNDIFSASAGNSVAAFNYPPTCGGISRLQKGNNMNTIEHFVAAAATLIGLLGAPARSQVRSPKTPIFFDDPSKNGCHF